MQRTEEPEKQYRRMLNEPIGKLILQMALPMVVSMLITVIYNTADTYFVSQINKSASAAVGAVYSVMAILQAVGYGLGMGSGSLISRALGQKRSELAQKYASSAFFLALLLGGLLGAAGLSVLRPMLRLLGCSETMLPYAVDYAKYILMAAPISCSVFVLNNTCRAEGEAMLSMWGMGIGGGLNLVLDPIFIFRLGLGAGGAALATAVSNGVSFVIFLFFFLSGRSALRIRLRSVSRKLSDYWLIFSTGLPTVCRQGLGSLASALLNIQAVVYGDAAVSAVTIANKVYVLVRNLVLGVGQGFMPVAGYNYGAGDRCRTWRAFSFTAKVGTAVCLAFAALSYGFAEPIMAWFSSDAEVIAIGVQTLHFAAAVMPFMAVSTYVNQLYQALGFRVQATFLASCRQGVFFVPAILLLPVFYHCVGVEAAQPAADFLTFFVAAAFLIVFYRKEFRNSVKNAKGESYGKS